MEQNRSGKKSDKQGVRMPDNLKRKGPEDPNTINTQQEWERKYWADKFGVTVDKLLSAVKAVGNSVVKVEAYLKKGV